MVASLANSDGGGLRAAGPAVMVFAFGWWKKLVGQGRWRERGGAVMVVPAPLEQKG